MNKTIKSAIIDFNINEINYTCLKFTLFLLLELKMNKLIECSFSSFSHIILISKNLTYLLFSKLVSSDDLVSLHVVIKKCQIILNIVNKQIKILESKKKIS